VDLDVVADADLVDEWAFEDVCLQGRIHYALTGVGLEREAQPAVPLVHYYLVDVYFERLAAEVYFVADLSYVAV